MGWRGLLLAAAASVAAAQSSANPLLAGVSIPADGLGLGVNISCAGWPAFALQSEDVQVRVNGTWLSASNGTLISFGGVSPAYAGSDAWGAFSAQAVAWAIPGASEPLLITTVRVYDSVPAVYFETAFAQALETGPAPDLLDRDDVAFAFPSFQLPAPGSSALGWVEWAGPFINQGSDGLPAGRWQRSMPGFVSGVGSGPYVVFDAAGGNAVAVSPAREFMAASVSLSADGTSLRHGVLGSYGSVPQWFVTGTVLWYGAGVNAAVMGLGRGLLLRSNKAPRRPDFTNDYLMYNTDHGAYYYYTTGSYSNYSTALAAVADYAAQEGIPYKAVLLDSWWYFKGIGDGVANWTAMPTIFTGGNAGIAALVQQTGWKITAHNRYWAADTPYAKQNGGPWDFFVDAPFSPAGGQMALPLDPEFWYWLLSTSAREWGLTTYEQDWLYNEFDGVDALLTNITLGRQWLTQMAAGAAKAGLTIQYCMPFPRHVLQSSELPAVTQARVSDDHVPGWMSSGNIQWRIGGSSLLAWAVGLAPFKDNAWSTPSQPGGSCGSAQEISPALQLAISTLSAGPVSPGDGVGYSDAALILRACNADGLLLHPSRAATAIDAQFIGAAFPGAPGAAQGEVYGTYTLLPGPGAGLVWDHVIAAQLNATFPLFPAALDGIRADIPLTALPAGRAGGATAAALAAFAPGAAAAAGALLGRGAAISGATLAYTLTNSTTFDASSLRVQPFNATSPITLQPVGQVDFPLWHTAPVMANGWALLGELSKWVPVSEGRVTAVQLNGGDLSVRVVGALGETVSLTFWNTEAAAPTTVSCTLGPSLAATVTMPYGLCLDG